MKERNEANGTLAMPPLRVIATIHTEFPEKFGIPRQSGLANTRGEIRFLPPYRTTDALRGLEGYSHIWLLWLFSKAIREEFSPTVRPPRLGGNERVGVFASRSPYRPNPIGLSAVKLLDICHGSPEGPVLLVEGADLLDGTPILDIKPYLPFADAHPEAVGGFADRVKEEALTVHAEEKLLSLLSPEQRRALLQILSQDPRPHYQEDPHRIYGFLFAGFEIKFCVLGKELTLLSIEKSK